MNYKNLDGPIVLVGQSNRKTSDFVAKHIKASPLLASLLAEIDHVLNCSAKQQFRHPMSSNFHVFLPEPPCKMSLSTPPVSWILPESDIPLAIQLRKSYNKSINCAFYIISGCGCRMDTYAYLAHLTEDGRTQTILEHLKGTASLLSLIHISEPTRRS